MSPALAVEPPTMTQRTWVLSLLAEHEGRLTRYAQRLTGDLSTARDVVQQVFLRLCDQPRETILNPTA